MKQETVKDAEFYNSKAQEIIIIYQLTFYFLIIEKISREYRFQIQLRDVINMFYYALFFYWQAGVNLCNWKRSNGSCPCLVAISRSVNILSIFEQLSIWNNMKCLFGLSLQFIKDFKPLSDNGHSKGHISQSLIHALEAFKRQLLTAC